MTFPLHLRAACVLVAASTLLPALAQQDRNAERNARRQQLQLQQLQQQIQQEQAAKTKAETERADLAKQLKQGEQAVSRGRAAQREADAKFKAVETARDELAAKLAELEKTLEAQRKTAEAALAEKDRELALAANRQKAGQGAQSELQARFAAQVRLVTECSDKNDRLVKLGAELLDRYRRKGIVDAARQRDPVLGLGDVEMFNLVQEYRDKLGSEAFVPSVERR
jgi:chromosome segregation ATPase